MVRRIGRPGLLGSMVRTAAIAGTATAVSGKVAQMQGRGAAPAAAPQPAPVQPQMTQAPAVAAAPSGMTEDMMEQLRQLAELHKTGVLTDEEFEVQKARILH